LFSFDSFELWNFIHVIDDLMLFVSFLDSTMHSIGNVICEDKKKTCFRSLRNKFWGLTVGWDIFGYWVRFLHVVEKNIALAL